MTVAYRSWGANAPASPELVLSFPDGTCHPHHPAAESNEAGPTPLAPQWPRPQPASSLAQGIELGERLLQLLASDDQVGVSRDSPKKTSLRALSESLHQVIPPSSIWRAIAIYQLSQEHPELLSYRHLGVAHLSVLLSLKGPLRLGLIRKAESLRWSRRHLQQIAREIKQAPERDWVGHFELSSYLDEPPGI